MQIENDDQKQQQASKKGDSSLDLSEPNFESTRLSASFAELATVSSAAMSDCFDVESDPKWGIPGEKLNFACDEKLHASSMISDCNQADRCSTQVTTCDSTTETGTTTYLQ